MKVHENLFHHYTSKADVYRKLQDDYLHDQKSFRWSTTAFSLLCALSLIIDHGTWKQALVVGAAIVAVQAILLFVDLSNRNFLMHGIDWLEASNRERVSVLTDEQV